MSAHVRGVALIASLVLPFHAGHAITAGSGPAPLQTLLAYPRTIVGLDRMRVGSAEFSLQASGAREIDAQLGLWRMPSAAAARLLPALRAQGLVTSVTPDLPLRSEATQAVGYCTDPLCDAEWWLHHVHADAWTPPGPGLPVTMIDSGADLSHPEFAGRPNTTALNLQTFSSSFEEAHGTATSSVVGAQLNGTGLGGIYPQAKLQLWDASPGGVLTVGDEIAGLAAARAHGPGVVNLSLGGADHLAVEEHAILRTFADVVAAAGERREAKLKVHLEEHVSLVRFDPVGNIELHLLAGAPKELANELREKLNAWTGKRWMVAVSKTAGERPLGEVARERAAAEVRDLQKHPAVAAVLRQFPDAEITSVRPLPGAEKDDTGTG